MRWRNRKLRKRLSSFETIFQKHAEICPRCRALIVWPLGDAMPEICRRCEKRLIEGDQEEESSIYLNVNRQWREIFHF
ncbi:hypothetical protein [Thermoflavimicrobium dichotomicum]|uniref:Uncharacterized protein n=1 Tax=Thermoflavimicrobium dichotomicum TaxID=46223 RepID=A0A1I3MLX5_9BACL|nr:hypothetical protein [Thermoflavimicrobium dichotomicum]SFI97997.1 hypothetical protein SAMN05421852_103123 [Thermoflavimicrobium dichotomicum]